MRIRTLLLATAMGGSLAGPAYGQTTPPGTAPEAPPSDIATTPAPVPDTADSSNDVVVVGSQIRGSRAVQEAYLGVDQ